MDKENSLLHLRAYLPVIEVYAQLSAIAQMNLYVPIPLASGDSQTIRVEFDLCYRRIGRFCGNLINHITKPDYLNHNQVERRP